MLKCSLKGFRDTTDGDEGSWDHGLENKRDNRFWGLEGDDLGFSPVVTAW